MVPRGVKSTIEPSISETNDTPNLNDDDQEDDLFVVAAGNFGRSYGVSFVEIGTMENLMGNLVK